MLVLPNGQGALKSSLTISLEDDSGQSIPDIEIKLLNTSKQILKTINTSISGVVVFSNLKPGDYFVRINKQTGYKAFNDTPVSVDGDSDISVVLELE